jgi:lipopolysaccharide transport system permease protein
MSQAAAVTEAPAREAPESVVRVRPPAGLVELGLRDLWHARELLYFLVWRDVKVRYKQTALGVAWALLQPFMTMVVFSIFFGRLAGMPSDGVPYPIFAYAALLPWQLFAAALGGLSGSVAGGQALISKVYFPRLVIPLAVVLGGLVDFGVAFGLLLALMGYYRVAPTLAILTVPLFLLLALLTALAVGLWLSVLNVRYRDVRYTVPFLLQLWMFATPVAYPSSLVPAAWSWVYGLNPMVGVIEGFRWALLGIPGRSPGLPLVVSTAVMVALLAGGLVYFRRAEATFADMV